MPKRKRSEEHTILAEGKQQLYLLLDDWERGYSVRRLDVAAFDAGANTDLPPTRFTEPPLARIEAPHVRFSNFVSHGSKIFAMRAKQASPAIPAFDTDTMGLIICPWPSCRDYVMPLFVSIGGKLFAFLEDRTEYLADPPPYDSEAPWSWRRTVKSPLPFNTTLIACYALHPDGRTLFASGGSRRKNQPPCTFSFDAERLEWTHRGDWLLPFDGQAYFDAELDAWVGLARDRDSAGYLCSCDVPPVDAKLTNPPSWKLGLDKMFSNESELHRGAKVIYMGDSKFCLIESRFHKDDQHLCCDPSDGHHRRCRVLHMTTFGLKYNKAGDLQITLRQAQACRMFTRPHDLTEPSLQPVAFWI